MRMAFTIKFDCAEADPEEVLHALHEQCRVLDMPNGDTIDLLNLDVEPVETSLRQSLTKERLDAALDSYWKAAYAEGREGRTYDTADGAAQLALQAVHAAVSELLATKQ